MKDESKTKKELIKELGELQRKLSRQDKLDPARLQTEENGREQARLLDLIFEHTLDGVVLMDKDFNFIRVNESYARSCHRDISEFPDKNHFDMYPSPLEEEVRPFVEEKRIYTSQARPFVFPDHPEWGTTYWDLSLVPILDSSGEVEFLLFTLKDVTDRKRAEEELKESEANLVRAQKVAHIGSWYLDLVEDNLIWSEENYSIFGVPKGTPMSYEKFLEIVHPKDRKYVDKKWNAALKNKPYDIEHRLLIGDEVKWVREKAELVFDAKGRPVSGVGITQDITERKRAEERLQTLSLALEQSPASTIILNKDLVIDYANPASAEATGYAADELVGEHVDILRSDEHPPEFYENIWARARSGKIWRGDVCGRQKDGKKIWELINVSPVKNPEGEVTRFLSVKVDDTERKMAEEQIKKSLKEKEVLLREIHHRVKNNLQVVSGLIDIQSLAVKSGKTTDLAGALEECRNRVKSMAVIHDLMLSSGDLSNIDIRQCVEIVGRDLIKNYNLEERVKFNIKGSEVLLGIDQAIPCSLVISELITNSLKHAFVDGRMGKVEITLTDNPSGTVEIIVFDNGVGIDKKIDFKNPHSVGLDLIRGLVEQIGGTIDLVRVKGTLFTINFKKE